MDIDRPLQFVNNHMMLSAGYFIVIILLLHDLYDTLTRRYRTATPDWAVQLLNQEDTVVVDVREPNEYSKGHIEGAIHIMFGRLKERLNELDAYKTSPVLVYCQQGTRSKEACKLLAKEGYTQVYNLDGGIISWQDRKYPLVRKDKK